ncbi:hypothetical protein MtrunA17_Chr6g0450981 [Medicago truncatula]|uniref:Uncharacterized protein n=1 Tax=Medicago truncatula TaxID=3880 RepID=A0A396HDF9_MEDTR|nr:hypothetical protein MtrunA17_Chr6g0450981 [Medicago truncatula]
MAELPRCTHSFLKAIWFWKDRNNHIFENAALHPYVLIEKVELDSFLWVKAKQPSFMYCFYDWWKHPILCMDVHG